MCERETLFVPIYRDDPVYIERERERGGERLSNPVVKFRTGSVQCSITFPLGPILCWVKTRAVVSIPLVKFRADSITFVFSPCGFKSVEPFGYVFELPTLSIH